MKKLFTLLFFCLFLFTACEEEMVVIPELTGTTSDRRVLIEEFTGVQCSACPQGASAIKDLQILFPGNVISVGIHATAFGSLGEPFSDSKYDLRTDYGGDIVDLLAPVTTIPAASINRTLFEGQNLAISPFTAWAALVQSELKKAPELSLTTTASFDSATRKLKVQGNMIPGQVISGDVRMVGYLTESHIIDKQLNGSDIIDDYDHAHILRDVLAGPGQETGTVEGFPLPTPLSTSELIPYEFEVFDVPEEDGTWIVENCHVVVFVVRYDDDNGTREVLQAAEVDFIQ